MAEEIKKKTTTATKAPTKAELEAKNSELEAKIAKLEGLLTKATEQIESTDDKPVNKNDKLTSDDLIEVISQRVGKMSISTEGYGKGIVYEFNGFGEIQDIPFGDLKDICRHNKKFAENGYFYILNDKAVEQLRLKSAYKRILTNDDIMSLFNKKPELVVELYKMTTNAQKECIIDMIVDKRLNGIDVDANILYQLEQLSGKKLMNIEA